MENYKLLDLLLEHKDLGQKSLYYTELNNVVESEKVNDKMQEIESKVMEDFDLELDSYGNIHKEIEDVKIIYYEWHYPERKKHEDTIPIQFHQITNRYSTPSLERVFPTSDRLVKIDLERYAKAIHSWGRKQHEKLNKLKKEIEEKGK